MKLDHLLQSDGLMQHSLRVTDVPERRPWLAQKCVNKSVLHVGCCDVPVFDPNNNLHIELARVTPRLDGLDISEEGIFVLSQHVYSEYFTSSDHVSKDYDLVLAPEVLEHTPDPRSFLESIFQVRAQSYLITAPHIQWYEQTSRQGDCFIEKVHGDHRAWYSPYTLLNAVRPFIDEDHDDLEIFLIAGVGSVGIEVRKPLVVSDWQRPWPHAGAENAAPIQGHLELAQQLLLEGRSGEALYIIAEERKTHPSPASYYLEAASLLALGRFLDVFRSSVEFMRAHPQDKRCLLFAASAAEGLNQVAEAQQLRQMAEALDSSSAHRLP